MKTRLYRAFTLGFIGSFGILAGATLAVAATTISGTGVSSNGSLVIDGPSTISIGTTTATGVTIGNESSTVLFPGPVSIIGTLPGGAPLGAQSGGTLNVSSTYTDLSNFPGTLNLISTLSDPTDEGGPFPASGNQLFLDDGVFISDGSGSINGSVDGGYNYVINQNTRAGKSIDAMAATWNEVDQYGTTPITNLIDEYNESSPNGSTGPVANLYGVWNSFPSGGVAPTNVFGFYDADLGPVGATNPYYSWFDSRGVLRVKEDSSIDGIGQAVQALYNNQLTKYTPGTPNYERLVLGEWNSSNVAEIGTESGGTGSARTIAFITASTTRMTIGADGSVGIGVTNSAVPLQVATPSTNATSTVIIGKTGQNKGSCLVMYDATGAVKYVSIQGGSLVVSVTSCE